MNNTEQKTWFSQMLSNKKFRLILVIIIIFMTIAIAVFTTREPDATVKGIRVKDISISDTWILFDVTLEVYNYNIIGGTLNSLEADIYYNDEYIGHARTTKKYDIKALDESTLHVDLRIDRLPSTLTPLTIRAKGTANISISFLSFTEHFDKEVLG